MTSRQLSSRFAHPARHGRYRQTILRIRRFFRRRAWEAVYGTFFGTVFVLCQSPAHALAVDDIRVLSRLGQPLAAEIVVTPAAGEVLNQGCFTATRATGELPDIGRVRLTLSRQLDRRVLNVTSSQPIREPLSEFVLQVKCPGIPTLVKSFLVMIDPPGTEAAAGPGQVALPATVAPRPIAARATTASPPAVRAVTGAPIEPGSRYTVRSGDMLSTIASRVAGRPDWSVWPIAQQIYRNNPGAFLLGDPNVIAQGAVVYIPRLRDIDMSAAPGLPSRAAAIAAPARPPAPVQAPAAAPVEALAPAPATPVQAKTPAATIPAARILPAPAALAAPAQPLPTLQLTTGLLRESQLKIELREQGVPVAPAQARIEPMQTADEPAPVPQSTPDRPDSVATDSRVALQADESQPGSTGLNWLWVLVGLLTGLLMGVAAAVIFLRRNLRREYEHDVREAVQRQAQIDRQRQQRDRQPEPEPAPERLPATAAMTLELERPAEAAGDHTVEVGSMPGLDFEVPSEQPEAAIPDPTTVEMPAVAEGLDLELPGSDTARTGQHEVDYDLLEQAYSEDYQAEFVDKAPPVEPAGAAEDEEAADGETSKFYHLENRDPADDTPLPIELGEDEMGSGDQDDGDSKIVRFRRGGN